MFNVVGWCYQTPFWGMRAWINSMGDPFPEDESVEKLDGRPLFGG